MSRRVVVGVDGGTPSLEAVRWAALAAHRRGASLRVVLAYHWQVPAVFAPRGDLAETAQQLAEMLAADAARAAEAATAGLDVTAEAALGHPAEVLLRAGHDAELLVVGTRGRHQAVGAVLGSVAQQVATHATCPVVVVRGRADPSGGVLVGVDGSPSADAALESAFLEAARWDCDVVAVRAIETPIGPPAVGLPPLLYDTAETRRALGEAATAHVAAAGQRHPQVPWEVHGVAGDAADVLCDRSRRARLVVVGSRGHGGFAGLLLGSVGLRLLHRADCPVLITRG
ncbi:universal stress protein [Dactylosporangium matsuzakiense]|uniref:Universal stress protein n=1 Tax=Dactylosporangium matsuzakiense TaxID=53360 RepID=A0A9W6NPN4_9ACTN|nr:universal stress protein [Dactylosporangium matsuzakiense]UWZ42336.1 universal stress protein [Dactylosporangium matsuzakiense]GLL05290.1 universal stress protein [Dactylosporangium matsuzakiense]